MYAVMRACIRRPYCEKSQRLFTLRTSRFFVRGLFCCRAAMPRTRATAMAEGPGHGPTQPVGAPMCGQSISMATTGSQYCSSFGGLVSFADPERARFHTLILTGPACALDLVTATLDPEASRSPCAHGMSNDKQDQTGTGGCGVETGTYAATFEWVVYSYAAYLLLRL